MRTSHPVFKQARQHIRLTRRLQLNLVVQAVVMLAIVGIVVYTVLFTPTPAIHDYFHPLRHHLMIIPCH